MTFNLSSLGLYLVGRFSNEWESVTPPHEGLRIYILVILREIQSAT
jgi:hypothetical protein